MSKRNKKNNLHTEVVKEPSAIINDGMNTPVPDSTLTDKLSKSEAALFKQAENPLGNPHQL